MEALEAVLAEERRGQKAKEARHKLTVERLRRQIVELQVPTTAAPAVAVLLPRVPWDSRGMRRN